MSRTLWLLVLLTATACGDRYYELGYVGHRTCAEIYQVCSSYAQQAPSWFSYVERQLECDDGYTACDCERGACHDASVEASFGGDS